MADKFAVYSDSANQVQIPQPMTLVTASLGAPTTSYSMAAAGTYTIPDALDANANAASKLFTFAVELSGGAGAARTLKLPQTPLANQLLVIKCIDADQSHLIIEPFDGSDNIDGAANYTMYTANQAVMLQAFSLGGGAWQWVVVAEGKKPHLQQISWGGVYPASVGNGLYYMAVAGPNSLFPPEADSHPWMVPGSGYVASFHARLSTSGFTTGSVTFRLRGRLGETMTLGPYTSATPAAEYETTTGAFSFSTGTWLYAEVEFSGGVTVGSVQVYVTAKVLTPG